MQDTLTDGDLLDRFVRGLHVDIQKEVLLAMPQNFDEACAIAERVAAVFRFTRGRGGQQRRPRHPDTSDTRTPGPGPMMLG